MTRSEWTRQALANAPPAKDFMPDRPDVLAKVTGVFSNTLGALANFVIVIAIGIYLAADPDAYVHGFARLFPKPRRARVLEVLAAIGTTLRWWLMGKFLSMIVVGVLTAAGLWLLGIPLAVTLALIAAALTFIPNIGPILAVVPAALLALLQSPMQVVYVCLLYLGIQTFESYLLTPPGAAPDDLAAAGLDDLRPGSGCRSRRWAGACSSHSSGSRSGSNRADDLFGGCAR